MKVINVCVVILKEEDETLKSADSGLQMRGDDDEELRMLASLKREQEENECRGSGLHVSHVSMSSDDASTWTHISTVCPSLELQYHI